MRQKTACSFGSPTVRLYSRSVSLMACVFLSLGAARAGAQATIQTFGTSTVGSYSGVIAASDGNFYAVSADEEYGGFASADYGCPDQSGNDCTFIEKITPSGTVTQLHTFETMGFGNNGGAPNTDGFGPTPLVEGSDGNLYGSAVSGGSAGYGTIFKISTTGTFTLLFTFPNTGTALNPVAPNGAYPSRLIFGMDGSLYGTSQQLNGGYFLFKVTTSGSLSIVASSIVPGDQAPQSIVQGSDGNFYAVNGGAFEQITLGGNVNQLHSFVMNGSQTMAPIGSLVEGPDRNFYGTDGMSGAIFQVSSSGSVNLIHTLQPADGGKLISPELMLASDGNFYGTTYVGGITTACPSGTQAGGGIGCGTVYQVTSTGSYTSLYNFLGTSVDGAQPDGWLLQGKSGSLYGTFFNPSPTAFSDTFNLSLTPSLPAPIQITFSPQSPQPNNELTVNWSVLNAFSLTMQQCHGTLSGGPSNTSTPLGTLTGSLSSDVYTGSYKFTPMAAGSYTFTLNCGGVETGSATVTVGNGVQITTTSPLPGGTVSKQYSTTIQAIGGITPYTWATDPTTPLPAGLTAGADSSGILNITGTPIQFGTYTVSIGVVDSSSPQQATQKSFQIAIASGLSLVPTLGNGKVGNAYNQTVSATGGLPPYKWGLASGALPDGLSLNANNGVISGTPTKAGNFSFSIGVADSEVTPATFTQLYTVSTVPEPLTVVYQDFQCKVHSPCTGSLSATGGTPPYTFTVSAQTPLPGQNPIYVTPPPTLTFNKDGSFSGTPTQYAAPPNSSNITFAVQVTDSEVPAVTANGLASFDIASDLTVTSIPLPTMNIGTIYIAPVPTASGGTPPYKWSASAGSTIESVYFGLTSQGQLTSPGAAGELLDTPGSYLFNYTVTDSEGVPAAATMEATLNVQATPVNSVTTLTSSNTSAATGTNVTLKATVTASTGVPTGIVTFYNGSASLGTATLDATGAASLTTSFNTAGVFTLTASYAGGGVVNGSVSAPVTETVVTPTVTATFSPANLTITSGSSGTLTLTLTSANGYTGTVGLSCGSLPAHVSCSFNPQLLTFSSGQTTATASLTVLTNSQLAVMSEPTNQRSTARDFLAIGLLPFWLLPLAGVRRKSPRVFRCMAIAAFAVGLAAFSGCGHTELAAPGTYSVPVNLQLSGGSTQQITVSVIVK